MGNVIRPNFGGKPHAAESSQETNDGDELSVDEEIMLADLRFCLANEDRVREATKRSEVITDYIFDLTGFQKKDESVKLRQNAMKSVSMEVLCSHLLDSSQPQWKAQPHFYGATILELHERCQLISHMKKIAAEGFDDSASKPPE